jgi:hypothetical protein
MTEPREMNVLTTCRDLMTRKNTRERGLALLETTTTQLTQVLGDSGTSLLKPVSVAQICHTEVSAPMGAETSLAQVDELGGFLYATPPLSS